MSSDIRIEHRDSHPLAVVRLMAHRQDLSRVVPEACGRVWAEVKRLGLQGAGRQIAVYLGQINVEVGVELEESFEGSGEVVGSGTPSGAVVWTTHYGPYELLHEAHTAVIRWCEKMDYVLAGPSWEIYGHWRDEWNTDPNLISTEVCYLVTGASVLSRGTE